MGVVLYLNWSISTFLGAILGSFLGDPARLGADFAFTALFIGLVAGFARGRVTLVAVAVSAAVAALVYRFVGPPWHVASGAIAGIAAAYIAANETARPMTIDPVTFLAILAMAAATYVTRIAGLFVADRLVLSGRAKAAFDAIPPAVLVSVIAPTALTTGWAEAIATAITAVAATRLPLLVTIACRRRIRRVSTDVDLADTPGRLVEPFARLVVDQSGQLFAHAGMILIEPGDLGRRQE